MADDSQQSTDAQASTQQPISPHELSYKECFLWGIFGAALPEIIRFKNIVSNGANLPEFSLVFCIISLIFIASGGLMAVALRTATPWQSNYIGATFPVLVSAMWEKPLAFPTTPQ